MLELIGLIATGAATAIGYVQSRRFVGGRLAYVDVARRPSAPWIAGLLAAAVVAPVVWLVPLVGTGTAVLFGAGVGIGTAAGAKDIYRRIRAG